MQFFGVETASFHVAMGDYDAVPFFGREFPAFCPSLLAVAIILSYCRVITLLKKYVRGDYEGEFQDKRTFEIVDHSISKLQHSQRVNEI